MEEVVITTGRGEEGCVGLTMIDMTRRNHILNYSRTHRFLGDGEFRKG